MRTTALKSEKQQHTLAALQKPHLCGTPSESNLTGSIPIGQIPTGSIPIGQIPTGSIPTGQIPISPRFHSLDWFPHYPESDKLEHTKFLDTHSRTHSLTHSLTHTYTHTHTHTHTHMHVLEPVIYTAWAFNMGTCVSRFWWWAEWLASFGGGTHMANTKSSGQHSFQFQTLTGTLFLLTHTTLKLSPSEQPSKPTCSEKLSSYIP